MSFKYSTTVNPQIGVIYESDNVELQFSQTQLGVIEKSGEKKLDFLVGNPETNHVYVNIEPGIWYMATMVVTDTAIEYYFNGEIIKKLKHTGNIHSDQGNLYATIATHRSNFYDFNGYVDNVSIYSCALDSVEVKLLYESNSYYIMKYDTIFVQDTIHVWDTCYVQIFDSISVTDTLIIDVNLSETNGHVHTSKIKVFPNPTNDILNIHIGNYANLEGYKIGIITTEGQEIYKTYINKGSYQVDLNLFSSEGRLYFIKIYNNSDTVIEIRKIILQ